MLINTIGCVSALNIRREYSPIDAKEHKYEDKNVVISYQPTTATSSIPLTIENKTKSAIKIIWDESSFINADGTSEKVVHEGIRLMDRNASQPPSMIPPMSKIQDSIAPTSRIEFITGQYGGWSYSPICGVNVEYNERGEDICLGKMFGFMITTEVGDKKNNITLRFKYTNREVIKPQPKQTVGQK
jgi:hypothetical protein